MATVKIFRCDCCSKLLEPEDRAIVFINGAIVKRNTFDVCVTCLSKVAKLFPTFEDFD